MIDKLIAEKAARINDIVESYLPPADGFNRTVCEAMAYSVEAGGKRLRPRTLPQSQHTFFFTRIKGRNLLPQERALFPVMEHGQLFHRL